MCWRTSPPLQNFRVDGEATIGLAFVNSIDAEFAAPQSNVVFSATDFYDDSGAFTWASISASCFRLPRRSI